jgi:hypothetical protein
MLTGGENTKPNVNMWWELVNGNTNQMLTCGENTNQMLTCGENTNQMLTCGENTHTKS